MSPGLLYHLITRDSGRISNEAFTSNPIVSSKQWFNGLNITNCYYRKITPRVYVFENFLVSNLNASLIIKCLFRAIVS